MELLSTIMLIVTVVFAAIIGLAALFGIFIGWKRTLIGLCRTIAAGLLAFAAIKMFCLIVPPAQLCNKIIFPILEKFPSVKDQIQMIYDSSALQTMSGSIIYTIILPFLFLPVFVILDSLLLIPAHFIGQALGVYASKAEKKAVKRQKREDKIAKKEEKLKAKFADNSSDATTAEETSKEIDEAKKEYTEMVEEIDKSEKSKDTAYKIFDKVGGFFIRGLNTTIVLLITILPLTGLIYTLTDGVSKVVNTADALELNIKADSQDQVILDHHITDSKGNYDFHEISLLVDETLSPVCDNFFLKLSYCAPMRALYTGIGGSSDGEGEFRNEITQIFDLVSDVLYFAVDFEDYGYEQKNAVNSIMAYISKSEIHSEIAADVISSTCQDLIDSGKLDEIAEGENGAAIKILLNPVVDIFANTTAKSVRTDVNTINDLIIAVIDYNIPYEIAVALATDSNDDLIHALANEDFIYEIINSIYQNEDFHDLIGPVINFSFFIVSRQFDPEIESVDVAGNLDGISDENLHYEAQVFSSIMLDAISIIDTIPEIMGSEDASDSIKSADMAAFGRFLDDAIDSLFIGENVKDLFVLILDSEVFENMRKVADVIKSHIDDEDLCMENLLTGIQQFTGILKNYEKSEGQDTTELANTLRKLSGTFDPTTSAIIKEIINDSSVLNMNMISGGSDEKTASTQKLLNVFVDQLASGNISDEEFEKEAKAVDYAMQLINASSSDDTSVKDVYSDSEGMQEMISTMAESKIASESIKAIAYDEEGNLTPDALELSDGLDDEDIATLKAECETYYKTEAIKSDADIETIDNNLKAIAAVLGQDITEDINSWKAELGINS